MVCKKDGQLLFTPEEQRLAGVPAELPEAMAGGIINRLLVKTNGMLGEFEQSRHFCDVWSMVEARTCLLEAVACRQLASNIGNLVTDQLIDEIDAFMTREDHEG